VREFEGMRKVVVKVEERVEGKRTEEMMWIG
jgi:hypothetical protein